MKKSISIVAVAAVMLAGLMSGTANADLIITLTEATDGGFTITGVGSGLMASAEQDGDWDIKNFNTNYLVGSASGIATDSVTGTMQNLTLGTSRVIDEIELDEDGGGAGTDDISLETTGNDIAELLFNQGDEYSINFSGTYLASTFLYSNLVEGTHIHSVGSEGDFFGQTTINVVLEAPSDCAYSSDVARTMGDTNHDCKVNFTDLATLASNWLADESLKLN
jgi:hypothetical protein